MSVLMFFSQPCTFEWKAMRPKKPSSFIRYLVINKQKYECYHMLSLNPARKQASCHLEETTRPPCRQRPTPLFKIATPSLLTASPPSAQMSYWRLLSGLEWQVGRATNMNSSWQCCPQTQREPQLACTAWLCDLG